MREGVCVHYNMQGMRDTCDAGVRYLDVLQPMTEKEREHQRQYGLTDSPYFAMVRRCPCRAENGVDTCPARRFPTPEEVAESKRRMKAAMGRTLAAINAVVEDGRPRGTMPCPAPGCPGILHFTTSPLRMRCTEEGCTAAME